jgi:hypothetical protein
MRAGGIGEAFQFEQVFVEVVLGIRPLERRTNQQRSFNGRRKIDNVPGDWSGD